MVPLLSNLFASVLLAVALWKCLPSRVADLKLAAVPPLWWSRDPVTKCGQRAE